MMFGLDIGWVFCGIYSFGVFISYLVMPSDLIKTPFPFLWPAVVVVMTLQFMLVRPVLFLRSLFHAPKTRTQWETKK